MEWSGGASTRAKWGKGEQSLWIQEKEGDREKRDVMKDSILERGNLLKRKKRREIPNMERGREEQNGMKGEGEGEGGEREREKRVERKG